MKRRILAILAAMMIAGGSAQAGTTMLGGGMANWFYTCGDGMRMNIAILHSDLSVTQFSLSHGQRLSTAVRRGDLVAWRCGAPVGPDDVFSPIVTSR